MVAYDKYEIGINYPRKEVIEFMMNIMKRLDFLVRVNVKYLSIKGTELEMEENPSDKNAR